MVGNHGSSSQMGSQQHNHGNSSMPISMSSAMNTNQLSDKASTGIPMMSSASLYKVPSQGDCFYNTSSGWDAIGSLSQSGHLGALSSTVTCGDFPASGSSYPMELDGALNSNASHHLTHYSSNPNLVQMLPKLPVLSSRGFSEMVNPFAMAGCAQNTGPLLPPNPIYASENIINPSNRECQSSRETAMAMSPNNSKRKRDSGPASPINLSKNSEGDPQRDASGETSDSKGSSNDKRQKMDPNPGVDQSTKKTGKQSKSNSQGGGEPAKEDYVHIRARRGQATNSHSLAERVRREKISERMRLLQELVPGCNKITGKAVMLDEIINYVQSLQQQVEFLSMKLAAVNPELNFDIEQLLTKDVLHSRGGSSQVHGYNPAISSPHPFTLGLHPSLPCLPNIAPPYHSMPQALWDGELQNLVPMDFDANPAAGKL